MLKIESLKIIALHDEQKALMFVRAYYIFLKKSFNLFLNVVNVKQM